MKRTGAVIVAAGLSSRMHEFKPLLPFGNGTIALHIVSMLKDAAVDPIVVVTGYRGEELEEHLFFTGVRFVKNERFMENQMWDSVKLGIREIVGECDRILIMPMDIPAILPETFAQVLRIDGDIVRTRYKDKTGHPLILRSEIARQLLAYQGDEGLKGAIANSGIPVCDVDVADEGVNKDVDTPEDYQALIEWDYARGNGYPVHVEISLELVASETFFRRETAQLLEYVEQTGSIQEACTKMEISYSKGMGLLKSAERQLGQQLVIRWTGGTGGGGAMVSEKGKRLARYYRKMEKTLQQQGEELYRRYLCEAAGELSPETENRK